MGGLTDAQYHGMIARQLGKAGDGAFTGEIALYWEMHADRAAVGGVMLRYLYTKRDALDLLLGEKVDEIDYKDDEVSESRSQASKNLHAIREQVVAEIERLEKRGRSGQAPVAGQIKQTSPVQVTNGVRPDPNDRAYRGDAIRRTPYDPFG